MARVKLSPALFKTNSIVWIFGLIDCGCVHDANNALLGRGVRVRVGIRGQRKIKLRSKALLSL